MEHSPRDARSGADDDAHYESSGSTQVGGDARAWRQPPLGATGGRATLIQSLSSVLHWSRTPGAGMLLLGAALAFGFIAASTTVAGAVKAVQERSTIRVKGVGTAPVASDQAWWTGVVNARAATMPEAFQRLKASADALESFLALRGVPTKDIEVGSVSTSTVMAQDAEGNRTNTIEFYALSQSIKVWSADVERIEEIARRATDLVADGHEIDSGRPRYLVSTIESLKLQLIEQATQNARDRADLLIDGSGGTLGRLISASQGAFDILCEGSGEFDGNGSYDQSCIKKEARVVVTLEYAVE